MNLFLLDAIPLDTELVSDYPEIVKLGDQLFEEVSGAVKISNEYRSKEVLKLVLINLYKGFIRDRAVRYSRDKAFYQSGTRYADIWFKYDRVIPVIDTLKDLGYVEYKEGLHYPDDDVLYQSRIWASQKLIDLFFDYHFQDIEYLKKNPPKEIIQLKARKEDGGYRLDYKDDNKTETMRSNLIRYNRFMEVQDIRVNLPGEVPVNFNFLLNRKGNIISQRIDITDFSTVLDKPVKIEDAECIEYELYGKRFIVADNIEAGSPAEEILSSLINDSDTNIYKSNYNQYFIQYINYILLHNQYNTNNTSTNNHHNTHTSMTQSFFLDRQKNQPLNLLNSTTVENANEKRPLSDYGINQLDFKSNYQRLHRVFVKYLDWGGRFYGAVHVDLPKEVREHITINNSRCIELDYSAHHIRILYNQNGVPYDKDPYAELCQDNDERPILKKVVLIAINAKNESEAIFACIKELKAEGYSGECLKYNYIRDCLERFKEYHKPIEWYLGKDRGIYLQYDDSRITDEILYQMVTKKIPVLPVHDSFLVAYDHEDRLLDVMVKSYQKIIGKDFKPIITKEF